MTSEEEVSAMYGLKAAESVELGSKVARGEYAQLLVCRRSKHDCVRLRRGEDNGIPHAALRRAHRATQPINSGFLQSIHSIKVSTLLSATTAR